MDLFGWLSKLFGGSVAARKPRTPRTPSPGAGTTPPGTATSGTSTVVRVPIDPVPVVTPGDPIDEERGDPVLSRMVDPSASQFKILGRAELYGPGEVVRFFVQALSFPQPERRDIPNAVGYRVPLAGLPVRIRAKHDARQLGPKVMTDEQGIAIVAYTVQKIDQKGDPSTPDPDTGSYLCNAYIGGRLLNTVVPLWDEW